MSPPPADAPAIDHTANGAAWAAVVSAGIGGATFGLLTVLSEASATASRALQWVRPVGSLSGVAIGTVVLWAAVWAVLHVRWRGRSIRRQRTLLAATCLLVVAAFMMTFPPFYELL